MAILRTIVWFFYFFGKLLVLTPTMYRVKRLRAAGEDEKAAEIINKQVQIWIGTLLRLAGVSVTVNGRENIPADRAVVFTPNHQSDYDIPLMLTQLGRVYPLVAKVETLKIPLVRTWMRLFDCVFIDRDNPRQAVSAIKEAGALLTGGTSIVVFPEGTRSKCDTMGEFKGGAFKMAFAAKAPIVPIVIDGSYRAMEANHNLMCPAHITMTILPAVETAQLDRAAQKALPAQVAASIAAHLPAQGGAN
ncbi:MAG: lysophospholipid acyltransferase family protein [Ruthenibacterium sp.]